MLLFEVLCVFLPCPPIFSSNWCSLGLSVTLVISLPGASESKAQMVAPRGAVSATVPVIPLVTLQSWRSLGALWV